MTLTLKQTEWKKIKLEKVIELISGQHIVASDYNTDKVGMPYLTGPSDFPNGKIITTKYTEKPKAVCKKGDILITVKGSGVGKTVISDGDYCISRQLMAIRTSKELRSIIYYNLKDREKLYNSDSVGLIPGISRKDILSTSFYLPTNLEESSKIGQILELWDKAIELKEKLIELKNEKKKGLMQNLLWGHIRWNDGEKFTKKQLQERKNMIIKGVVPEGFQKVKRFIIPQDWKFVKINKVAQQVSTIFKENNENNDHVVLSCTKYDGLVDSLKYFGKQVFSSDLSKYKVVLKKHFAYATNHIEEGSIGLQRDYDYGLVSPMYTVFKAKSDINNEFLYAILKTENYRRIYETMMSASVDRRGSLRWDEFSTIEVPLPSLKEQEKIITIILTADKEIKSLKREVEYFKKQKKGLMQLLLTGKVRVKV